MNRFVCKYFTASWFGFIMVVLVTSGTMILSILFFSGKAEAWNTYNHFISTILNIIFGVSFGSISIVTWVLIIYAYIQFKKGVMPE